MKLHEELLNRPPPATTECFETLLRRLVHRFPEQVGGRAGGAGSTWVEPAPPVAALDGAVLSLALYDQGPSELLPHLIDEAGDLGMTVLDEQGGCLYLPGRLQLDTDGVSRRPARKQPAVKATDRLTERGVKACIKALLQAPLRDHGFQLGKGGDTWCEFVRETPAGLQMIKIYRAQEVWQHLFYCTLVPLLPAEVALAVHPARDIRIRVPVGPEMSGFAMRDYSHMFDCFVADTSEDLHRLIAAFLVSIEKRCLPVLDACRTVPGILAVDASAQGDGPRFSESAVLLALCHLENDDMAQVLERQVQKSGGDRGTRRRLTETASRLQALASGSAV